MNEIKFRLISDNKIVGYCRWFEGNKYFLSGWEYRLPGVPSWRHEKDGGFIPHNKKDWFTGMTDIQERDIYSGDIVESWYAAGGVVCFTCGSFVLENPNHIFKYNPKWENPTSIMPICGIGARNNKIIGNIYENPELLEKGGLNA